MSLLTQRMRNPTHLGRMEGATVVAAVGNPACGDVLTLHLSIEEEVIQAASFESLGSAYQMATASVLCDEVTGLSVARAKACDPSCILGPLPDLPQRHHYLARLGIDALRRAIEEYEHGAPAKAAGEPMDASGGRAFVRRILGNSQRWTTRDIEAMAEAEAIDLPEATVRFLSGMRKQGLIQGEMDPKRKTWVWWL